MKVLENWKRITEFVMFVLVAQKKHVSYYILKKSLLIVIVVNIKENLGLQDFGKYYMINLEIQEIHTIQKNTEYIFIIIEL